MRGFGLLEKPAFKKRKMFSTTISSRKDLVSTLIDLNISDYIT